MDEAAAQAKLYERVGALGLSEPTPYLRSSKPRSIVTMTGDYCHSIVDQIVDAGLHLHGCGVHLSTTTFCVCVPFVCPCSQSRLYWHGTCNILLKTARRKTCQSGYAERSALQEAYHNGLDLK